MQAAIAQLGGVLQRLLHPTLELAFPPGQGRDAAFARAPVSRRRVEQGLRQTVVRQAGLQVCGGEVIGKQELDAGKPVLGSRLEAIQEGMLGVHHGQVSG
ncbi:hypothetical protein G6F57_022543 [Rhizopus arrhizus]|nr:hypothetical protein G6F57_022543 [Rhizopus arrhizus]